MPIIKKIRPQVGFQRKFVKSKADIVIGGGGAGGGKTYGMLLDYSRYVEHPYYGGVIFRRTSPQITNEGGLWDTAEILFTKFGKLRPKFNQSKHSLKFPSGAKLRFSHLQHEKDKLSWQGSQIPYLGFDELTHFSKSQFFYLLTRNRSATKIKCVCRATCNPQGMGWVKDFLQWWIYPDNYPDERLAGYPIPEREGVLRYFTQYKAKYVWGSTPIEVLDQLPADVACELDENSIKSVTFIPGPLEGNKILMENDPSYKANLLAGDAETKARLYDGRWLKLDDDRLKLFAWNAIRDCFTNFFVDRGQMYMTCDIALEGADRFVVCVWDEMRLEKIYTYDKTTGPEVLAKIREIAKKHRVPASHIAFDADGVGGAFSGFFKTSYAFRNGSKAIPVDGEPQNYANLKTQCYYMLKKYVNEYLMYFNVQDEHSIDMIMEELYAVEKKETSRETLQINSKPEVRALIGRSPDIADAIMMRMVFLLPGVLKKGRRKSKLV